MKLCKCAFSQEAIRKRRSVLRGDLKRTNGFFLFATKKDLEKLKRGK